jgi:DNA-binding CsgD family transcriptional regulator
MTGGHREAIRLEGNDVDRVGAAQPTSGSGALAATAARLIEDRRNEDWPALAAAWNEYGSNLPFNFPSAAAVAFTALPWGVLNQHPILRVAAEITSSVLDVRVDPTNRRMLRGMMMVGENTPLDHLLRASSDELAVLGTVMIIGRRGDGDFDVAWRRGQRIDTELRRRRSAGLGGATARNMAWFYQQHGLTALLRNDLPEALRLSTLASEFVAPAATDFIPAGASAQVTLVFALLGDAQRAHVWLAKDRGLGAAGPRYDHMIRLPSRVARGLLLLDEGDLTAARLVLWETGDGTDDVELWAAAASLAAAIAVVEGRPAEGLALLDHTIALHPGTFTSSVLAAGLLTTARVDLLLACGETERAAAELESPLMPAGARFVARARLTLLTGNPEGAAAHSRAGLVAPTLTLRERVALTLLAAAAASELQDDDAVRRGMSELVSMNERCAPVRELLSLPEPTRSRLVAGLSPEEQIRLGIGLAQGRVFVQGDPAVEVFSSIRNCVRLSPRERDAIAALADGATIADIAAARFVSVNTVKKQVSSLYRKLGVSGRREAIDTALRLGFATRHTQQGRDATS